MKPPETLYLVCGLLSDATVWKHQLDHLGAEYDVRVASFPGIASILEMARTLLAGAPSEFCIAGHSMGGRVALEVFRLAGDRVKRLALLDTGFGPARPSEPAARRELIKIARARGMAAMAEAWIPTIIHPDRLADAELVGALSAMAQRNSPEEFARQIQALLGRPDMRHLLPAIRCPTLICCGRQDAWAGVAQHEEMAALIRDCRLAVIEHCGHLVTMERPDAVNRLLSGWLTA